MMLRNNGSDDENIFPDMQDASSFSGSLPIDGRVLDISVYRTEQGIIEIRFDIICAYGYQTEFFPRDLHEKFMQFNRTGNYYSSKSQHILEEAFYHTDLKLKKFKSNPIFHWEEIIDKISCRYVKSSIFHQLSLIPHVALNWLGCLSDYFDDNKCNFKSIHFKEKQNTNPLQNTNPFMIRGETGDDLVSMEEYIKFENIKNKIQLKLLEAILSLEHGDTDPYKYTLNAIQKIGTAYHLGLKEDRPFFEYLEIGKRCEIIFGNIANEICDEKNQESDKVNLLLEAGKGLIKNNQQAEFNYLLRNISHLARKKLFEHCLGIRAPDKGFYNMHYTEYSFLQYAEFIMKDDKTMGIVNLKKNPGYQWFYADGKSGHGLFNDEMVFLTRVLGIEMTPNCDVHREIIFTEESTKKLKAAGLHLTEPYIKKLVYAKNFWSFFSNCQIDKSGVGTNILDLPKDTLNVIQEDMEMARTAPVLGK